MIEIRKVDVAFGGKIVLNQIEFEVSEGEIVAIMGSSGGGKTTLLRTISGLLKPTKGEVFFHGISMTKSPLEARKQMGMVFQSSALFDSLTVSENIKFGVARRNEKLSRKELNQAVQEALEQVGLPGEEKKMPAELSGGMRKRVGIARALALKPKSLLYDEPTTGLDPVATYLIDELMLKVRDEFNMTSLLVSHDVSSVLRVADRVAFLNEGKLIFLGEPKEFIQCEEPAIQEMLTKSGAILK